MYKISGKSILTILIYFYIVLPLINSQESKDKPLPEDSQKRYKESVEKFEKINILYTNITEQMSDIKYNLLLIFRYKFLVSKHETIIAKIDKIKASLVFKNKSEEMILKDIHNLNEYINSYNKSCHKIMSLYESFENLKKTILNLIKIFFLTLAILILIVLIISGIILFSYFKKRRNYNILKEEITHTDFVDVKNSELERIQIDSEINEKKKEKKHKNKNKKKKEKTENIEVLDDK